MKKGAKKRQPAVVGLIAVLRRLTNTASSARRSNKYNRSSSRHPGGIPGGQMLWSLNINAEGAAVELAPVLMPTSRSSGESTEALVVIKNTEAAAAERVEEGVAG